MSLIDTLFQPDILTALLLFVVVSIFLEIAAYRVLGLIAAIRGTEWLVSHAVIPAARAAALVAFILVAYPTLFGLDSAPAIGELLAQGRSRFMTLVNLIFVLSLLLPLLPVINRIPALILPLQGIAAASLVFHWWAATQTTVDIHYWPGWITAASLVVLAILTHELARWLASRLGKPLDRLIDRVGAGN